MSINGSKGRARYFARVKRELSAEARSMGIDPANREEFNRWRAERSRSFLAGIAEQSRCRCGGIKHATITGTEV